MLSVAQSVDLLTGMRALAHRFVAGCGSRLAGGEDWLQVYARATRPSRTDSGLALCGVAHL